MSTDKENPTPQAITSTGIAAFLEGIPPNQPTEIVKLTINVPRGAFSAEVVFLPEIHLHCPEPKCNGMRFFRYVNKQEQAPEVSSQQFSFFFVTYRCWNCQNHERTFALAARSNPENHAGEAYKFGEFPPFGPPTPARLITLIGPDREIFLKGRRCENQGLGIGAFIYYRRVVENQKGRIFSEIRRVADKVNAPASTLAALDAATRETQFSRALQIAKDGIPESLLINGHNPMLLLHSALSEGVHKKSDEECMEIASSVRVVLGELSERLGQALKDEAELQHALSTLMNKGIKDESEKKGPSGVKESNPNVAGEDGENGSGGNS